MLKWKVGSYLATVYMGRRPKPKSAERPGSRIAWRMGRLAAGALIAALGLAALGGGSPGALQSLDAKMSYVATFEIVASYPHSVAAFTQGLVFDE